MATYKTKRKCEDCGKAFEFEAYVDAENGPSPRDAEPQGPTLCEPCGDKALAMWHRKLKEVEDDAKQQYAEGWITANERDRRIENFMNGVDA